MLGVEFDTEWKVTEVVPSQTIRVEGNSQHNGKASLTQRITAEGTGARVSLEVDDDPPYGILGEIADKVVFVRVRWTPPAVRYRSACTWTPRPADRPRDMPGRS